MATATLRSACGLASSELRGAKLQAQRQRKSSAAASHSRRPMTCRADAEEPLLLRAAKQQAVERPPAWMMRQAGRYMKVYQDLTKKYPSFRQRSETTDLIVDITLQPWRAFRPDGVILFSDILTPLDAMGIPFEIDENKGPVVDKPIRAQGDFGELHDIDFGRVNFVAESLGILRKEIGNTATLLGFVGAPWTLATYCVEGGTTRTYTIIKSMTYSAPDVLAKLLGFLAKQIGEYAKFQIEAGAQVVQVFDSWGGQLTPEDWEVWSKPYIQQVINAVKEKYPEVPVVLYAYGSSGLLERMSTVGADVIGLDWHTDMAEGRRRVGSHMAVQGNVDPAVLYASPEAITKAITRCVTKAGPVGHIVNLGHGVLPGTPEENVAHFFSTVQSLSYADHDLRQPVGAGSSR